VKGHRVRIFEALADTGGPPAQLPIDSSAVSAHRSASGAKGEAAQADDRDPRARGHMAAHPARSARRAGAGLHRRRGAAAPPAAGRARDAGRRGLRQQRRARPDRRNRKRNAVGRMFGRLKDARRIATRYDRRADVFLSAVALAAIVNYRS
jgi:transposase